MLTPITNRNFLIKLKSFIFTEKILLNLNKTFMLNNIHEKADHEI